MNEAGNIWAPPDGSPVGTSGWYAASDGRWYRSTKPPASGYWLHQNGRWYSPAEAAEPWQTSRWGLGEMWWGVFAYLVTGFAGAGAIALLATDGGAFDETGPYAIGVYVALSAISVIGILSVATRRKGLRSLRADFGLSGRWLDPLIGLGLGIGGMIVAGFVTYAIDSAFGADEPTSNLPVDDLTSIGQFAVFFLAVAVVTPVIEELFFRGLIYRSMLKRRRSALRSMLVTTAIFIVPHLPSAESWSGLVSLAAAIGTLGLAFNLACRWTGNRLVAPIVAHAVVNGVAALVLYYR
jgi:CAAX protease family protein